MTYLSSPIKRSKSTLRFLLIRIDLYIKGKVHPRTGHEGPEGSRCLALLLF